MSYSCKDCEHAIITEVNCFYYGHTNATVDCECEKHISKEELIRADERKKILKELKEKHYELGQVNFYQAIEYLENTIKNGFHGGN